MTDTPTPDDASEEAISASDVVNYVVNKVKQNPKAYAIGGVVVAFVVLKKFRGKDTVKAVENFTPGSIRMFPGAFGTDTYELSVMLKGDELRKAMAANGLSVTTQK